MLSPIIRDAGLVARQEDGHEDGQDGEGAAQGAGTTIATRPFLQIIRAAIRGVMYSLSLSRSLTDTAETDTDRRDRGMGMGADMGMRVDTVDSAGGDRQHDLVALHGAHKTVVLDGGVVQVVRVLILMGNWKNTIQTLR